MGRYEKAGTHIGALVDEKNAAYGDAFNRAGVMCAGMGCWERCGMNPRRR